MKANINGSSFVDLFENHLMGMKGWEELEGIWEWVLGSFHKGHKEEKIYKFAVYLLLINNFTLNQSAESIMQIGCKIIQYKKFFIDQNMGLLRLELFLMVSNIKSFSKSSCVVDYICNRFRGKKGFRISSYNIFKEEIEIRLWTTIG